MLRRLAFLLAPRWLSLYAIVSVATVVMVFLGRWQLQRAHQRHGDLQNYSYVLQWWAFSLFVVFMLFRVIRDAVRGRDRGGSDVVAAQEVRRASLEAAAPVAYRRYQRPENPAEPLDEFQTSYNNYLASLEKPDGSVKDRR